LRAVKHLIYVGEGELNLREQHGDRFTAIIGAQIQSLGSIPTEILGQFFVFYRGSHYGLSRYTIADDKQPQFYYNLSAHAGCM
jgi:hypothetical protein